MDRGIRIYTGNGCGEVAGRLGCVPRGMREQGRGARVLTSQTSVGLQSGFSSPPLFFLFTYLLLFCSTYYRITQSHTYIYTHQHTYALN